MSHASPLVIGYSPDDLRRAAELLRAGELVSFPTETVYGLGADATNDTAVARIFAAKSRPSFNPLIAHVADVDQIAQYVHLTDAARRMAEAFWPGPLTMVLPLKPGVGISPLVTAGGDSLAVRVPGHPVARALLRAVGGPVAAPSANPSGRISPTTAQHVADGLGGAVAAIVDAGPCAVGVESTIVDLRGVPTLLRAGGVSVDDIGARLGHELAAAPNTDAAPVAPGQLTSHYAPRGAVRLNATAPEPGEVMVGFGDVAGDLTLSRTGDLVEAAASLFACLHDLDAQGAERIAVAPIPDHGLGLAINDRLRRAAAPRQA